MLHYFEDEWSDPPLSLHMLLSESGSLLRQSGLRGNARTNHQEKKNTPFTEKEEEEAASETSDYYLDCDGVIYTCGISNLALFRHRTNQGSLASSSPWQSPATGSKTNFSSCRPSTTGNDWPTLNSTGFLERIGRGSCLCFVPFLWIHAPGLHWCYTSMFYLV